MSVIEAHDQETSPERVAEVVIKEKVPRKWATLDKPPEERRFLFKLDAALLTFASLGNAINSLRMETFSQLIHFYRLLYQVSGSVKCEQCICIWNVSPSDRALQRNSLTLFTGRNNWVYTAIS